MPYKKNSTDIKTWLHDYTVIVDGEPTYPERGCADLLPAHSVPKERTDTTSTCYDDPYHPPACGTYGMGKGEWPKPYPAQTFENLSVLTGVTFTYSGTTITATKTAHGMVIGNEPFTISGQIGTNAVLNGSWSVASVIDENRFTFIISTAPTTALAAANLDFRHNMDFCTGHGFKAVHAKKLWNGRYGFISDYIANPKVSSKFKEYNVSTQIADSVSDETNSYGSDGSLVFKSYGSLEINGNANTKQLLTAGGVRDCYGSVFYAPGAGQYHERFPGNPSSDSDRDYWRLGVGPGFLVQTDYPELPYNDIFKGKNENGMKDSCGIDSDRAIVRIPWPWHFNTIQPQFYQGTIDGFGAWVEQLNIETNTSVYTINGPTIGGVTYSEWGDSRETRKYTISNYSVTETSITFKIDVSQIIQSGVQLVPYNEEPQPRPEIYYGSKYSYNYIGSYTGNASLGSEYTAGACQAEAQSLLSQWDMTDDAVYPWRTDGNCNVAPMVIRKEISGGVGYGYCDVPADANLLSIYDGSIYGAPLPAAYYDKGWFDFYEQEYHYIDAGAGCDDGGSLCYTYGNYAPAYLPTTTTHWTDGASDTSCRPIANFQPFTRFKERYAYDTPVFVTNSCAFVQNNQEAFWAGKWAEIKEPLPSQNYWGICGVQPNQCATDSHGTGFGITCPPMRDLKVLDAETCEITGTDRYPTAFAICGKAAIVSMSRDSGSGVVTVVHASTPLLRTGDAVDFINAGDTVTVSNVTVTVDSNTQFHFTGSLPTGNFIVSHGATGFSFYDLAPKGYFVRTSSNKYVVTAEEGNVQSTGAKVGIIAILPLGSPELGSPKWPARSTVQYTDYPAILPTEYWLSSINQAMSDRFWVKSQDTQISDGGDPAVCVSKNQDGTPCDPYGDPCVPLITPLVEARLHAPTGAPLQFTADNLTPTPQWYKMPGQTDWSFSCSNVWNYGESLTAFTNQYGVANNYGDSLNTTGISTDTDTGWGLADQYFIP